MANEIGGIGEGLDIGGSPREDINKITEEAVRRVQEQSQQAQQVHQEIKKDKAINNKLAEFLAFLMKQVENEQLVKGLYSLFFKVKDPKTGVTYLRKKINTLVVVGLFYPFYQEEGKKLGINPFFEGLFNSAVELNLTGYIDYIKQLSAKYHDNIPLDQEFLITFLGEIIQHFKLYVFKELSEEERNQFFLQLKNELYGK